MEKLKIGYDVLKEINPRIILSSTSGYGSSGPFAHRAGYDMIVGAEGGLLHVTGERGGGPIRPGLSLVDLGTGLYMQGAIMGALYARERTGVGQKLEGSLFETQVSLLANVGLSWLNTGVEAQRWGTQHPTVVPYDAFEAKDGYFVGGATNDKQFVKLARILGKPELAEDPRFSTNTKRVQHRDEISKIVNELFKKKTIEEWNEAFESSGMPYGGVNSMERVFKHPQSKARNMVVEMPHEAATKGTMSVIGPAIKWSGTPTSIRSKPPLHGEHSDEVLAELGIDEAQRDELRSQGTIK
ncbi:hypothetical protein LTR37_004903 [Vermiconidia calcicola]|uniref:Uncharacterized protein n=1 Tax=Vermiconidia calcicola TaxID=1690605 RepID=A0ACC3NKZ4_9PEZI|nr:hypothetical protein LTR37_004903 [Vermiconidia calcicola]